MKALPHPHLKARRLAVAAAAALAFIVPSSLRAEMTTYTDETAYLIELLRLGYTTVDEGFEGAAWDGVRSTIGDQNKAPSVTSQGITWTHNFPGTPNNQITTGLGAARTGSYGLYALPHGNFLSGSCTVTGVCGDGFRGSTPPGTLMFAVGGWVRTNTPPAQIGVFLDGAPASVDFGDTSLNGPHRFFGVIDTAGFNEFEYREMEGTAEDAKLIFSDDFTVALAAAGCGSNTPPAAAFTFSQAGPDIAFTDASSDTDGTVVQWLWDFGDGNFSNQRNPSHTYASNGTFPAVLYVRDDGNCAGASPPQMILIASYPPADVAITYPANGATVSGTITLTVDITDPPSVVEQVTYVLDDNEFDNSEEDPFSIQWDSTGSPDGVHTLEARLTKFDTTEIWSDPVTFTVSNAPPPTPLEIWRGQHFSAADLADPAKEATVWGDDANPDHDGLANWHEFVFGGDPNDGNDADCGVTVAVDSVGVEDILYISFNRRINDASLVYTPEVSPDMQSWYSGLVYTEETSVSPIDAEFERVTFADLGVVVGNGRCFGRVVVMKQIVP